MAVEISFVSVLYLISEMLLKVNYFVADKGKSLNCTVFGKAKMIFLRVYTKFQNFQMIFYTVL